MKKKVVEFLENGRIAGWPYASPRGVTYGAFIIKSPGTNEYAKVLLSDGVGWEEMGLPLPAWEHVSMSFENRLPTWEEMFWLKNLVFEPEECVVQFHPPKSEYRNHHPNCLHLWKMVGTEFPRPPAICVAPEEASEQREPCPPRAG